MKNPKWNATKVLSSLTIRHAMSAIDIGGMQIALIVDQNDRLLGTVTDGDIRRALLKGYSLDQSVTTAMNVDPIVKSPQSDPNEVERIAASRHARQIPLVDLDGRVFGIETIALSVHQQPHPSTAEHDVVLMAGGLGTRLYPLTQDVPKPMLPIGGRPILETIVSRFAEQGFERLYIAVNYRAELIQEHFGDGSKFGIKIEYLKENDKLGTAGALGLLPHKPAKAFIVMNCDVLTNIKFDRLLDFHSKHGNVATMAVREYDFQVPYGVVKVDEKSNITGIDEKPTHRFFVNAGIYVLDPKALTHLKSAEALDMPQLFRRFNDCGLSASAFPICEYWIDVGQRQDLERAEGDFVRVFGTV